MTNNTPLIHVVDDDDSLRTSLLRLLAAAGFTARGYPSAGDFLMHPPPNQPGCLLLDLSMPGPSGLDLQTALARHDMGLPVIFLTGHATVESGVRTMKAGAVDFLIKPVESGALFDALRRALARDAQQRADRQAADALRASFASLTPREREIFDFVVAGRLNKQIAVELGIAERTVKLQRAHVMTKLGVGSAAELGQMAERLRVLADG